ncbi:MAG TPA: ATP-binding protein [Alphaproteobacteria bacterium]
MSAPEPKEAVTRPSLTRRLSLPGPVAALIGALAALILFGIANDVFELLGDEASPERGGFLANVDVICAAGALCLVVALTAVLMRQFNRLRALSRELIREQDRLRIVAELGSDWFWETDAEDRFTVMSGSHPVEVGLRPSEQLIGKSRRDLLREGPLLGDAEDESWRRHFADVAARRPIRNFVYSTKAKSGEVVSVSISGAPMFDEKGVFLGYRGIASDVTASNRAERELREAKDVAEAANRAKSEFLANMSHELRTPLNAIIGFSDMMGSELFGRLGHGKYLEYARDIHTSGSHLLALINDVLDMSKIEAGRMELDEGIVNLGSVVEACLAMVEWRATQAGVGHGERPRFTVPNIVGDERAIRQVMLNLLTNAVKFTPRGGHVTVSGGVDAGGDVVVTIADTGVGIAPDVLQRLFAPFQQGAAGFARRQEGTGLGLAISRNLMRLHGGELEIRSEPGEGTVATARFPASRVVSLPLDKIS